jgi:hypothetical protein
MNGWEMGRTTVIYSVTSSYSSSLLVFDDVGLLIQGRTR